MWADVRDEKLETIVRCLERLEEKKTASSDELRGDLDRQEVILLNLQRLIQTSIDLALALISEKGWGPPPKTLAESFVVLEKNGAIDSKLSQRLQKAVSFRNVLVHEYSSLNLDIVQSILDRELSVFREFGKAIQLQ